MDEGLTKSEEMLSINADYADFSNFLHQKTNVPFDSSILLQDFYRLGDTYKCEVRSKKVCYAFYSCNKCTLMLDARR